MNINLSFKEPCVIRKKDVNVPYQPLTVAVFSNIQPRYCL